MTSELPRIFGLYAVCSTLTQRKWWLPQTQQPIQYPSYLACSAGYEVLRKWIGRKMPNGPIRFEKDRLISSQQAPALESSHHLPH
jgi:hypothetical protein